MLTIEKIFNAQEGNVILTLRINSLITSGSVVRSFFVFLFVYKCMNTHSYSILSWEDYYKKMQLHTHKECSVAHCTVTLATRVLS